MCECGKRKYKHEGEKEEQSNRKQRVTEWKYKLSNAISESAVCQLSFPGKLLNTNSQAETCLLQRRK